MTKKSIILIIIALLLGVIATLFVAQHDEWVQDQCITYIKQKIEEDTHCRLFYKSKKIGFFFPELTLEDVYAYSDTGLDTGLDIERSKDQAGQENKEWSWRAQKVTVFFSWFHILKHWSVDFHVRIQGCHIETNVCDNVPAIYSYICSFFASSAALPIASFVKEVELLDSSLKMVDDQKELVINTRFKSVSKELFGAFKTVVNVADADLQLYGNTVVSHAEGLMTITLPGFLAYQAWQGPWLQVDVDLSADIPHLDKTTCFVAGSWRDNEGTFSVQHLEQQVALDPLIIKRDPQGLYLDMQARFPVSYAWRLYASARENGKDEDEKSGESCFAGLADLHVQGYVTGDQECQAQLTVKDLTYNNQMCCQQLTVSATHKNKQDTNKQQAACQEKSQAESQAEKYISADVTASVYGVELAGKGQIQYETGCASFELSNVKRVAIPGLQYWYLDPQSAQCAISREAGGALTGFYECTVQDPVHQHAYAASGQFKHQDGELSSEGAINSGTYTVRASLDPFYLHTGEYLDQAGTRLAVLSSPKSALCTSTNSASTNSVNSTNSVSTISGTISYGLARSLLNGIAGVDVQGQGTIKVDASCSDQHLNLQLGLKDGMIRLPHTYNFIDNFEVALEADFAARTLTMRNLLCGLQTGSLRCERATVQFDEAKNIDFVHAPFVFDRCLFNIQKNLFAMISGSCLLEKRGQDFAHLKSTVIIDRAHAKDAAFLSSVYTACSTAMSAFSASHATHASAGTGSVPVPATPGAPTIAQPSSMQAASDMSLDVTLETKEPISLDTPLLKADIGVRLAVAGTITHPRVEGDLTIDAGSLMFPYKPLQITKGLVRFDADNLFNPTVELRAKNRIKKHEVMLYVHGSLQDHHVLLDASPALTEEQIVSLLFVGSPEESLSAMVPALIMQNLKMALLGSGTGSSFLDSYFKQSRMPFSVHLVPSFTDQTGRGGLRGGLEFLVNDRWRALIQKNFSLSEDTRFELEYSFSDDVGVRVIRDERRDLGGELEMRWKF